MDISHGHTFISLFFIVLLFSFYHGLFGCIAYTLCPISCLPMDCHSAPVALLRVVVLNRTCFSCFVFIAKVAFFSDEWRTIRLRSRKWVKDAHNQRCYWSIHELPYQTITNNLVRGIVQTVRLDLDSVVVSIIDLTR